MFIQFGQLIWEVLLYTIWKYSL